MTSAARPDNAILQSQSLRAAMDIVIWLRSLGLGRYEAASRFSVQVPLARPERGGLRNFNQCIRKL